VATKVATRRRASSFLRGLERALAEDAEEEIQVLLKVAVLVATGHSHREVGERLELTPAQIRSAVGRLRRVSPGFDRYGGGG
jgi:hypothetical protein